MESRINCTFNGESDINDGAESPWLWNMPCSDRNDTQWQRAESKKASAPLPLVGWLRVVGQCSLGGPPTLVQLQDVNVYKVAV
jgi:hypothetical protein